MNNQKTEANEDGRAAALAVAPCSAGTPHPMAFRRVLRINRLLSEVGHADVKSALLELKRLRETLGQIAGNDRQWNELWAARVATEALSPNVKDEPRPL